MLHCIPCPQTTNLMCLPICVWRPEVNTAGLSLPLSTLFLDTGPLIEPGVHCLGWAGWPGGLGLSCLPCMWAHAYSAGVTDVYWHSHFSCGCWELESSWPSCLLKQALSQSVMTWFLTWKVTVRTWGFDKLSAENEKHESYLWKVALPVASDNLHFTTGGPGVLKTYLGHSGTRAPLILKSILMKLVVSPPEYTLGMLCRDMCG